MKEQDGCDLFLVTEHWKFKDQIEAHTFEIFQLVSAFCRDNMDHGGSAIYIRQKYTSSTLTELNFHSAEGNIEACGCVVKLNNKKKCYCAYISRPTVYMKYSWIDWKL